MIITGDQLRSLQPARRSPRVSVSRGLQGLEAVNLGDDVVLPVLDAEAFEGVIGDVIDAATLDAEAGRVYERTSGYVRSPTGVAEQSIVNDWFGTGRFVEFLGYDNPALWESIRRWDAQALDAVVDEYGSGTVLELPSKLSTEAAEKDAVQLSRELNAWQLAPKVKGKVTRQALTFWPVYIRAVAGSFNGKVTGPQVSVGYLDPYDSVQRDVIDAALRHWRTEADSIKGKVTGWLRSRNEQILDALEAGRQLWQQATGKKSSVPPREAPAPGMPEVPDVPGLPSPEEAWKDFKKIIGWGLVGVGAIVLVPPLISTVRVFLPKR